MSAIATKWAFAAFWFLCVGAQAASKTHVCATELALFVSQTAKSYTRTVIYNNSRALAQRGGLDPEIFSRLYSVDDILQDIQMQFLKSSGFDPGFHGDKDTLELNNHLKTWIKKTVNRRIEYLVEHTRRNSVRELRELPRQTTDSGGWIELDIADPKLPLTVLDLVANRQEQGENIASDFSRVEPDTGISQEQWEALLRLSPRWVEAACESQNTPTQLFWAHKGGLFTATDFAEELLEQTLRWLKTRRGNLELEGNLNAIAEVTAQKMVEELTGTLEVRERALAWMRNSSLKGRNGAVYYALFYIEGMPAHEMMEREGLDKAAVSYRKKTAQRTYFEFASVLLQYPPTLQFPLPGFELNESEYLTVIAGIEAELGGTATPEKRLLAINEARTVLDPHVTAEGTLKLKKADLSKAIKLAVNRALDKLK